MCQQPGSWHETRTYASTLFSDTGQIFTSTGTCICSITYLVYQVSQLSSIWIPL